MKQIFKVRAEGDLGDYGRAIEYDKESLLTALTQMAKLIRHDDHHNYRNGNDAHFWFYAHASLTSLVSKLEDELRR